MYDFKLYDVNTAPDDSRSELEKIKLLHGNIHNIYAVMAESPLLLKAHTSLKALFDKSELGRVEREVVLLTASREDDSPYSVAVQSAAAEKDSVPSDVIDAIRANRPLKDKKLETLRSFTARVVNSRGHIAERDVNDFLAAGYTRANILEIVLAVGMVALTDYTSVIAKPPLDKQFESKMWKKTA